MVSTRRSGSLSGNNSKRSSSSDDKPTSPKRQKVFMEEKSFLCLFWLRVVDVGERQSLDFWFGCEL